jgi:hypothetical protein
VVVDALQRLSVGDDDSAGDGKAVKSGEGAKSTEDTHKSHHEDEDGEDEDGEDEGGEDTAVARATKEAEKLVATLSTTTAAEEFDRKQVLRMVQHSRVPLPPPVPPSLPSSPSLPGHVPEGRTFPSTAALVPSTPFRQLLVYGLTSGRAGGVVVASSEPHFHQSVKPVVDYVLSLPSSGADGGGDHPASPSDRMPLNATPPAPEEKRMLRLIAILPGYLRRTGPVAPMYELAEKENQAANMGKESSKKNSKKQAAEAAKAERAAKLVAKRRRGRLATTIQLRFEGLRLRLLAAGALPCSVSGSAPVAAETIRSKSERIAAKRERIAALQELKRLKVRV